MRKIYFLIIVWFISFVFVQAKENLSCSGDNYEEYFSHRVENTNNVVLTWSISHDVENLSFYRIMRDGEIIAEFLPPGIVTYTDKNLAAGHYHYFLIVHYKHGATMEMHSGCLDIFNYLIPEHFSGVEINSNSVLLRWGLNGWGEEPEYYRIERDGSIITSVSQGIRHYEDRDLEWGLHTYRILACYRNGQIFISKDVVEFAVGDVGYALPANFVAVVNKNHVGLLWGLTNSSGKKPRDYILERNNRIIATIGGDTLMYYDSDLEIGDYEYRLSAVYRDGLGYRVELPVHVTIKEIEEYSPYNIPFDFRYDLDRGNNVILFWRIDEDREARSPIYYDIWRDGRHIAQPRGDVLRYYDADLEKGAEYTYSLIAIYDDWSLQKIGHGLTVYTYDVDAPIHFSGDVEMRRMILDDGFSERIFSPINFSCTVSDNNITLNWEIPERGIQPHHYYIERNGEFLIEIGGDSRAYRDYDLEIGTYAYRLIAFWWDEYILATPIIIGAVQFCY